MVTGPLQHCHRVEGTGGGLMEETAAALSAASPSVDGMPSSSLCQPRQREQQRLLLLYVTKVDLKYTILTALPILVVYSQPTMRAVAYILATKLCSFYQVYMQ